MQSYRRYNRKNTTPSLVQVVPEHGQDKSKRVRIVQKTHPDATGIPTDPQKTRVRVLTRVNTVPQTGGRHTGHGSADH